MARSTIDAIRQVEKETLEAEKQAAADARLLSARTKEDAEKLVREEAQAKQKELIDQKSRETAAAAENLKTAAGAKSKEAVRAILDIVSG